MNSHRWKKVDCIVCPTAVTSNELKDSSVIVAPCRACNGNLVFFLNNNDEIAHSPNGEIVGTWGKKFQLLDDEGVADWLPETSSKS